MTTDLKPHDHNMTQRNTSHIRRSTKQCKSMVLTQTQRVYSYLADHDHAAELRYPPMMRTSVRDDSHENLKKKNSSVNNWLKAANFVLSDKNQQQSTTKSTDHSMELHWTINSREHKERTSVNECGIDSILQTGSTIKTYETQRL